MSKIKRIPYGLADFEAFAAGQDYYVDKTMFIPEIERQRFNFLLRPRRFGKSLFLSTLQSYYDINKRERFEEFYRDTWILNNPTDERASYLVLYFNFSAVAKDIKVLEDSFNKHCGNSIDSFLRRYQWMLPNDVSAKIANEPMAHERLSIACTELAGLEHKIYIMIDEYDNFTNTIISEHGGARYRGMTHGGGFFRDFFSVLKAAATGSGSALGRMFITGVSPVTMDDVTSGFNIGENISHSPALNDCFGMTQVEVEEILDYYIGVGEFKADRATALEVMREWHDGYCFADNVEETVYNTDMVLYFLNQTMRCLRGIPRELVDPNVKTDYGKLHHLMSVDREGGLALNGNFSKLKEISDNGSVICEVRSTFPHERLAERDNFISLIYHLGFVTRAGEQDGRPMLAIPNETMRQMLYEHVREGFKCSGEFAVDIHRLGNLIAAMAYHAEWKPVFEFIAAEINRQTRIRDYLHGEKVVQGFILAYLNIHDQYLSLSEEESGKGYADIVLKPFTAKYRDIPYAYLLELKYIPRTDDQARLAERIEEKLAAARAQLARYADDDFARRMLSNPPYGRVALRKGIVIFHGWEMVAIEECEQPALTT